MPRVPDMTTNSSGWSDWHYPVRNKFRQICCDCCNSHDWEFRVSEGQIQFRIRANDRSTAAARRKNKKTGEKK